MRNLLTMTEDAFSRLDEQLSRRADCESLALGFLALVESPTQREFLLRDEDHPRDEDYRAQSASLVSLKAEKLAEALVRSRQYRGVLLAHNHLGQAFVSRADERGIGKVARNIEDFGKGNFWLQLIRGDNGIFARIGSASIGGATTPGSAEAGEPVDRVKVIGERGIRLLIPLNSRLKSERIPIDLARHGRTLGLLGENGGTTLETLQSLRYGLIGAGGVMSAFATVFKFLGPRRIVVVDSDRVERSNANRFFGYLPGDEGALKVDVTRRELVAFDPELEVRAVPSSFPGDESLGALKDCDVWVAGPDNHFCRYWASHYASRYMKPLLEFGSGIRLDKRQGRPVAVGSQVRLQLPTATGKCLVCNGLNVDGLVNPAYERFNRAAGLATGYIKDSELPTPASVVTINMMAAALGCRTLLSYLSGIGSVPSHMEYDELRCELRDLSSLLPKRPDCPICGRGPESVWGWGDLLPPHLRPMDVPEETSGSHGTTPA